MTDIVERISQWFESHGHDAFDGTRREPVTELEHALQCAWLAESAQAEAGLVVAALLHDVGHFVSPGDLGWKNVDDVDDRHEVRAAAVLAPCFDASVVEPVRLHVEAKRYLTAVDPAYAVALSPASAHSLSLQGGPMTSGERRRFELQPYADEAVLLRRWDDLAKQPGRGTPPLRHYLALVEELLAQPRPGPSSARA